MRRRSSGSPDIDHAGRSRFGSRLYHVGQARYGQFFGKLGLCQFSGSSSHKLNLVSLRFQSTCGLLMSALVEMRELAAVSFGRIKVMTGNTLN
jgi:hypothetical protein